MPKLEVVVSQDSVWNQLRSSAEAAARKMLDAAPSASP